MAWREAAARIARRAPFSFKGGTARKHGREVVVLQRDEAAAGACNEILRHALTIVMRSGYARDDGVVSKVASTHALLTTRASPAAAARG